MTNELIMILSDFKEAIESYTVGVIPFEEELFDALKILNQKLGVELEKQKLPEVEV